MQSIGQLDDEHANVARHGDEHLAHRCRLLRLFRIEPKSLEFRHSVDDRGDFGAEFAFDLFDGDFCVFDGIVQQGGGKRHFIKTNVGNDLGYGDRMVDVRLATTPHLVLMSSTCSEVRPVDERDRRLRMTRAIRRQQWCKFFGRGGRLPPPGKNAVTRSHTVPSR